jgi:hypothetical protein
MLIPGLQIASAQPQRINWSGKAMVRVMGDDDRAVELATEEAEIAAKADLCEQQCKKEHGSSSECELRGVQRATSFIKKTTEGLFVELTVRTRYQPTCFMN